MGRRTGSRYSLSAFVLAHLFLTLLPLTAQQYLIFRDGFESGGFTCWAVYLTPMFTVTITMEEETVKDLCDGGFFLYGFKAVHSTDLAARPLVWFKRNDYSTTTPVTWANQHQAYLSFSEIEQGEQIFVNSSVDIDLGQIWRVESTATGPVVIGGPAMAISILNSSTRQFTCGISQVAEVGTFSPLCAFPLFDGFVDVITPLDKVLLIFSTLPVKPNTVIERSLFELASRSIGKIDRTAVSPGILIDLTGVEQRAVRFDINGGWDWGGFAWARAVGATEDLVPLLIERSPIY